MTPKPRKPRKVVVWAVVDVDYGTIYGAYDSERRAADHARGFRGVRIVRCEGVLK